MFRTVVLFCAVLAFTTAHIVRWPTTDVSRCHSNYNVGPLPIYAYIPGCFAQPCDLPQGQNVDIKIIFQAPYVIRQMKTAAFAYIGVIPINYDLGPMAVTCNFLANTNCPLAQNETALYTLSLHIEDFMPVGTQLPIEFRILDDANLGIMCFRTVVRIVPGDGQFEAQNGTMTAEV